MEFVNLLYHGRLLSHALQVVSFGSETKRAEGLDKAKESCRVDEDENENERVVV